MGSELLNYFNGDELAANVWQGKYAQEGEETPDDMHKRLAKEFARIEEKYIDDMNMNCTFTVEEAYEKLSKYGVERKDLDEEDIYNLFKDFKHIIPQGSIMSQLGAKSIGSLSNCFVIGQPEDSYGGIFRKDEEMAQLMKRRGGVGIDISTLRPQGTSTSNAAKSSTGAVSFMHRFSNTTREVAQNGRRGALMISIDINHPDVMDFIKIKRDGTSVTGANISIKINNKFMKAVEADEDYILKFPCNHDLAIMWNEEWKKDTLYEALDEKHNLVYVKKIKAKEYWDEIIKSAHGYAEPGIIFVDNHHNYSPDGVYSQFKGVTTNPCGEIFMQPYDACRLIAVNLYSFVENPFTPEAKFDFDKFYRVNYEAMRLSDDLIDLEIEHIDRILAKLESDPESETIKWTEIDLWHRVKETAQASRRTGLGFTALGDTLAALGLKYDSNEALNVIENIMDWKLKSELDCTTDLAILRGTFDGFDLSREFDIAGDDMNGYVPTGGQNAFYQMLYDKFPEEALRIMKYGRRNVSWSTVAPTGTVSLMCQTTSGIEPLFMGFYMRRKKVNPNDKDVRVDFTDQNGDTWQEFPVLHPKFRVWAEHYTETLGIENYTNEALQELFKKSPWYGSTANDIDWIKRVQIQSIIQKYTTHSISSTINLPNDVSEEEVSKIYLESWKKGLKGITVYRDGSRDGVLISSETNKSRNEFNYVDAVKRPKELDAEVHITKVGGVPYYVIVGLLNGKPYEIFIENRQIPQGKGKMIKQSGGNYKFVQEGYEQLITAEMTDEQTAITRLASTSLRHGADIKFLVEQLQKTPGDIFSFTKGLARVLKKYIPNGAKSTVTCLDCGGSNVIFEEGCNKCKDCGSSKCG